MICKKEKCTGCFACYNICPKKCIDMIEDEYGFIYPKINLTKCIKCNLCRTVCPEINTPKMNKASIAYAAWSLNDELRKTSSSGGIATTLSRCIINKGGVVFGCASIKDEVKHVKVKNLGDLNKLKGSKYVHSYIENTYKEAKKELKDDKYVLFIGTPCQIAGLKNYLKYEYSKLITIDIICHGVPAQKFLKEYVIDKISEDSYDSISFRDKDGFNIKVLEKNKIIYRINVDKSIYYKGFLNSLFYRENCYNCNYANPKRVSDITLGDFWGLDGNDFSDKDKELGISVILPNTKKGEIFLLECSKEIFMKKRELSEAIKGNDQLRQPSIKHKAHNRFKKLYLKRGFNYSAKKCLQTDMLIEKLKKILRKNEKMYFTLKRFIKKSN
ncbi:Coenzyme F420 hydrogenase/dehydrogenase, beta subunit C-terminal domain [Clostridium perfringens]|nr:Coenzyme F420 hydrogenase/dehydrogenase, beta subunit C-terminal domain [Clostridium perfringens]